MTILELKVMFILIVKDINWYIIFVNDRKISGLAVCFNDQPKMSAFILKIEKYIVFMMRILQSDIQTTLSLIDEKNFLESFNKCIQYEYC